MFEARLRSPFCKPRANLRPDRVDANPRFNRPAWMPREMDVPGFATLLQSGGRCPSRDPRLAAVPTNKALRVT
ncbi:hypothetical protein DDF84_019195 [Cupriavidus metallidurans]|uniref:Uncharacterized protein n=1 Tax=Cupriavidus metallidurans TaxID=119219 RepID=A0A482IYA1_9BURK|nr:hypothetical protein DDF84_019195 [Cupriavidus metallidurans]